MPVCSVSYLLANYQMSGSSREMMIIQTIYLSLYGLPLDYEWTTAWNDRQCQALRQFKVNKREEFYQVPNLSQILSFSSPSLISEPYQNHNLCQFWSNTLLLFHLLSIPFVKKTLEFQLLKPLSSRMILVRTESGSDCLKRQNSTKTKLDWMKSAHKNQRLSAKTLRNYKDCLK